MLAKHEFAGNKPTLTAPVAEGSQTASRGGAGHGPRGRGRGGRGRGGRGGGGGGSGDTAQERAWKDKNKARRGNHDRKRGHDKKMAKVGGPS